MWRRRNAETVSHVLVRVQLVLMDFDAGVCNVNEAYGATVKTFDGETLSATSDDMTAGNPCSFVVAKHRHPNPNFEVRAALRVCGHDQTKLCVESVEAMVGETRISLEPENQTVTVCMLLSHLYTTEMYIIKVVLLKNGQSVPVSSESNLYTLTVSRSTGKAHLSLTTVNVDIVFDPKASSLGAFSVSMPSALYKGSVGGLCGKHWCKGLP